jgi:dipeptidyl aminopeptidase/acylaminoacyl peptidase
VERVLDSAASTYLVDSDGVSLLCLAMTFVDPPELTLDGRRVTHLNDDLLRDVARPEVRRLDVSAPDGLRIETWALVPAGDQGPWPTLLHPHGGPWTASMGNGYSIDHHLLVDAGFAVVVHNFRGSGGYGYEFVEKITHGWGPNAGQDHHAALDAAIAAGVADPERLGVFGLSHGGYATCWLVGTSDRFKAAVAENPVTSFVTYFGVSHGESWVPMEMGGYPWEVPDVYRERSPLTYASSCRTPLLFVIGESDLNCHQTEAEQYYRVLKTNGVPTEMLRLPNAHHGGTWSGPIPARDAQNEALVGWFRRYV